MDLSNKSCDILIKCGNLTGGPKKFNEQTTIEQIHKYISEEFGKNLPSSYQIVYYDTKSMSFIDLEDQLLHGSNPFQSHLSFGVESTTYSSNSIHFYIIANTSVKLDIHDDQIVSNHNDKELSQHSLSTNEDISQDLSIDNNDQLFKVSTKDSDLRLHFSLDVKSNQRDIYRSDQFSIRKEKANGRIARIQGIKSSEQKMLQVLPKLRIPLSCFQSDFNLIVAVVTEKIENGMRIWYKNPHKGFLPENFDKDTKTINPIILKLDQNNLTVNGDFPLSLQMITKWNKSQKASEEFYRCDENRARKLHSAEHDSTSPRLFCVLQRHGVIDWKSFCLSDYIRPPIRSKERSSSVTIGSKRSPSRKRLKIITLITAFQ